MVAWDINAAEAMGVVRRAAGRAQQYETDVKGVETAMSGLGTSLPHSELVAHAVGEFAGNVVSPHVKEVVGHTGSALFGTSEAVKAYVDGSLEMAATAQANAAKADYPDMPGGRGGGGGAAASATTGPRNAR